MLPEIELPQRKALAGKVALIVGSSRGIGKAIALELADRGAIVAINCRIGVSGAEEVRDRVIRNGDESRVFQGDVADKYEARRVVKEVLDEYRQLDILVNNAGITRDKSIRKMTDDDWSQVIDTNLNGPYYCTSAALTAMIEQKFGRIVSIAFLLRPGRELWPGELCCKQRRYYCVHQSAGIGTWRNTTSRRTS